MSHIDDIDPQETREWQESLDAVLAHDGPDRAAYVLDAVLDRARRRGVSPLLPLDTDYVNTVRPEDEPDYPGDLAIEERIGRIIRWNAAVMVSRANSLHDGLGGHMSTYASSATFLETCFHHVFRGKDAASRGDQIYFQGHGSPGLYARAFLEGRLEEEQLDRFRRETERGKGLSSYPHPRLMPEFWEFPTVSMGLGPLSAIYQARFNRYLHQRGLCDTSGSRVFCFLGDGECDEPESLGALSIAAREGLDNLCFVINCNLQRLDGPVRGNGKIVQELERIFRGSGWNVVKCIWGSGWDRLLEQDADGVLVERLNTIVDGDLQRFTRLDTPEARDAFFGAEGPLRELFDRAGGPELELLRGGHDPRKVHAAFRRALEFEGRPTVILVHTVKGWGLGSSFEGSNPTHQMKKMNPEQLTELRDRLEIPVTDEELGKGAFYRPDPDSEEMRYLLERRRELGGFLPERRVQIAKEIALPDDELYAEFYEGSGDREISTTMAFVRLLTKLLKEKEGLGPRIVPIVPDESRTFGMEALFRQIGIYAPFGQSYEPVDAASLMSYKESAEGQLLQEGINEAGSMASFTAAGTSYATHGEPMMPFYIFYSMFGFQRVGDLAWAFGDLRGRGFLLGATAGRTTLNGEGLQHEDGHSQVLASTIPNLVSYDPAYAFEIAAIVKEGLRRMTGEGEDVFYYLTLQNENYPMLPAPSKGKKMEEQIVKGMYLLREADSRKLMHVEIFGSAVSINAALEAQQILSERYDVSADVWSVTSYQQLRADALACERWNRLHPTKKARVPYLVKTLEGREGPFVAVTDYMKIVPEQIARWLPGRLVPLGTDGYGMSDTREALRRHFETDAPSVVLAALDALRHEGSLDAKTVARAIKDLDIDPDKIDPLAV